MQLALLLIFIVCMFFVTNLPRLLLNLYELFNVDDMISCGVHFVPPGEHFVAKMRYKLFFFFVLFVALLTYFRFKSLVVEKKIVIHEELNIHTRLTFHVKVVEKSERVYSRFLVNFGKRVIGVVKIPTLWD